MKLDVNICKYNLALFLRAVLLLTPIMLLFYQDNGLTAHELFFFQGLFYFTSIISEMPIGYLSDRIKRKYILLLSFIIFFAITLLWLFYKGYYVVMLGEIMFAISKVSLDNAMSGYLYDYLEQQNKTEKMVRNYGYLNFFLALGTAVAAILGTYLYSKYGYHKILVIELFLILIGIMLVLSLPNLGVTKNTSLKFIDEAKKFINNAKAIYGNCKIKYHIFYSGILTSMSILFALSFQPIMKNAFFPVFMFGVIAFLNHGIRALSGIVAGKWLRNLNLRYLIFPLLITYSLGFVCVFAAFGFKNITTVTLLILTLCLIIGLQLIFTILHISRCHKYINTENRGNLMSINNFISRCAAAIILLSSKLLLDKLGFQLYYGIIFVLFLIICIFLSVKTYKIKE